MTDRELFVSTVIDLMKENAPHLAENPIERVTPKSDDVILGFFFFERVGVGKPEHVALNIVASAREIKMNAGHMPLLADTRVKNALCTYKNLRPAGSTVLSDDVARRIILEMQAAA